MISKGFRLEFLSTLLRRRDSSWLSELPMLTPIIDSFTLFTNLLYTSAFHQERMQMVGENGLAKGLCLCVCGTQSLSGGTDDTQRFQTRVSECSCALKRLLLAV